MPSDRMFRVIVLGGIALTGAPACSASDTQSADAASSDAPDAHADGTDTGFPKEGPVVATRGPTP